MPIDVPASGKRLRIALPTGIFPPDIGGPASYVPRIAEALTLRGHAVSVITLADDPDPAAEYPFPVMRIARRTARIPRMARTISAVADAARDADVIYANGLFIEAAFAAAIARKPLLMKIVGDWAWERARNCGAGGDSVEEFQSRAQAPRWEAVKRLRTEVTRRADRILTPSRYLRGVVSAWGVPEDRITVVCNALEDPPDAPPAEMPLFAGRTLITVARLVRWKGIDEIIDMLPEKADWRVVVIGDGPERESLMSLAERRGVSDRVMFTGGVPRAKVFSYMKSSDAFVLNSLYEGLPHILLEAFAAGLPVVAAASGGTREVVDDGVNGLLVPPRRKEMLAAAVEKVFSDPKLRRGLIDGGRRTLQSRFRWETMVAETETLLADTAARREAGR